MNSDNRPLLPKIMDLLLDTVCVVDPDGKFVFVSASCEALLGYTPDELIGRQMIDLVHPEDRERTRAAAAAVMEGRSHIHFENRYLRKDGSLVDIMWSARWSEEDQLRLAVARDVTPLKVAARKQNALYEISEAAFVAEDLSALYQHVHRIVNRLIPSDLFLVATCDRATGSLDFPYCSEWQIQGTRQPLALFYVDLDNFKEINDNFGHDAGDEILREIAARLSRCVRQADTVARIGGDEFTILADHIDGLSAVDSLREKFRATVAIPFAVKGANLDMSASIGAAVYPDHGSDRKALLQYADSHMYRAKRGDRR